MGGTNAETATQGLDGLGKRCAEYYALDADLLNGEQYLRLETDFHLRWP